MWDYVGRPWGGSFLKDIWWGAAELVLSEALTHSNKSKLGVTQTLVNLNHFLELVIGGQKRVLGNQHHCDLFLFSLLRSRKMVVKILYCVICAKKNHPEGLWALFCFAFLFLHIYSFIYLFILFILIVVQV